MFAGFLHAIDFVEVIGPGRNVDAGGTGIVGAIQLTDTLPTLAGAIGPGLVSDKTGGKDQGE